jgi:hypothetical protein
VTQTGGCRPYEWVILALVTTVTRRAVAPKEARRPGPAGAAAAGVALVQPGLVRKDNAGGGTIVRWKLRKHVRRLSCGVNASIPGRSRLAPRFNPPHASLHQLRSNV